LCEAARGSAHVTRWAKTARKTVLASFSQTVRFGKCLIGLARPERFELPTAIEEAWARSNGSERHRHLLGALQLCGPFGPLPDWLFTALRELVIARPPETSMKRWDMVLAFRDGAGLTWEESYERASRRLSRTPAKGSAETMRKSYQRIERSLRPEQRRERTWRRRLG
jgi:hypothetical protein